MSRKTEIIEDLQLKPTGKPGEYARPGINMHAISRENGRGNGINMHAILPKVPAQVEDGTSGRGIAGLIRGGRLRRRVAQIIEGDQKGIKAQQQVEGEAATLRKRLREFADFKEQFTSIVGNLPDEEQALFKDILDRRSDLREQLMEQLGKVNAGKQKRHEVRENGYKPIGNRWGDSALVTENGFQVFTPGKENDIEPEADFSYESIANGRLQFSVVDREKRRRQLGPLSRIFNPPGTLSVTDTITGRSYLLRGVQHPEVFIDNIISTAQAIAVGDQAEDEVAKMVREYPEILRAV